MRALNEIVVHCSATRPEWWADRSTAAKVSEIRRWHVSDRGWRDIGYHYVIDRNGVVATGRPLDQVGAHVQGRNTGTIGICLIGGHGSSENDRFEDNFTAAQDAALRKLIADLRGRFPSIKTVSGHNQYAAKACPGFNVPAWHRGQVKQTPKSEHVAPDVLKPSPWARLVSVLLSLFNSPKR